MAFVQNNPEYRGHILTSNNVIVGQMLEQAHACRWARLDAKRDRDMLFIEWIFNASAGDPKRYSVEGGVTIIPIVPDPDPEKLFLTHIVATNGNGAMSLKLKEGISYFFHFFFTDKKHFDAEHIEGNVDVIMFQVAMPMSEETTAILTRAVKLEHDPEERVKEDLDIILRKTNAFNEKLRQSIEKIKAKALPLEEENREIENFKDEAERVKEKHGM
jgi:hypothetical protein